MPRRNPGVRGKAGTRKGPGHAMMTQPISLTAIRRERRLLRKALKEVSPVHSYTVSDIAQLADGFPASYMPAEGQTVVGGDIVRKDFEARVGVLKEHIAALGRVRDLWVVNEPLDERSAELYHPDFHAYAVGRFGSWKNTVASADFDYEEVFRLADPNLDPERIRKPRRPVVYTGQHRFMDEAASFDFLDKDEQFNIFREYNWCMVQANKLMMEGEDGGLAETLLKQAREAKELIVGSHMLFVASVALEYQTRIPVGFPELFSMGCDGLLDAVEGFDYTRGNAFTTYAGSWIRQPITKGRPDYPVHIPAYRLTLAGKYGSFCDDYRTVHGRRPSDAEVMDAMGLSRSRLETAKRTKSMLAGRPSIEEAEMNEPSLASREADHHSDIVSEIEERIEGIGDPRDRHIVELRVAGHTYVDIARLLPGSGYEPISREAVRQTALRYFRTIENDLRVMHPSLGL